MRLTPSTFLVTVFLAVATPLMITPLSAAPNARPTGTTAAAGATHRAQDDAAVRRSAQAFWNRRQAKDLDGMYDFYSARYRARVSREAFRQQTRLVRFDLSGATVDRVDVAGERATATITYQLRLPTLGEAPVTSSATETWIREARQWRKLDEPLELPFPTALSAATAIVPAPDVETPDQRPDEAPAASQAQAVAAQSDGLVSVNVEQASLGEVLRGLSALGAFSKFAVGADADSRQVTVHLNGVPLPVAVVEVLKAADVAYVFSGGPDSQVPFRLVADVVEIAAAGSAPAALAASQSAPTVGGGEPEDDADAPARAVAARAAAAQTEQTATNLGQALATPRTPVQALGSVALPFSMTAAPLLQVVTPAALHALPFATAAGPSPSGTAFAGPRLPTPPDSRQEPLQESSLRAFTQAVAPPPSVPVR